VRPAANNGQARVASVFTHRRTQETAPAIQALRRAAERTGTVLRVSEEERRKHDLVPTDGLEVDGGTAGVDVCLALGGDGTILTALRMYAGTGVPVFGVNFGEIGFLATVDRDGLEGAFMRALSGEYEVMRLPGIELREDGGRWIAINDVAIHRRPGNRVADLSYSVGEDEVGRVRCDGLVVATPAGSTGYNLANGGPIMAWGVEGYAVSFIAPHSLTARALVVAPGDVLTIHNRSQEEPVDAVVDGRPATELAAGGRLQVSFADCAAMLAQLPGASFYQRLRQKFGRLASVR
jgi:NAD+ kinase